MTHKSDTAPAADQADARAEATNAYFRARHLMLDTIGNRRIFEAGFDQAYALQTGHPPARMRDIAQWKHDSELLQFIQSRRWDVRFSSGVASVGVQIIASGKQAPDEQILGVEYADDLRGALEQAAVADGLLFAGPEAKESPRGEAVADVLCGAVLWRANITLPEDGTVLYTAPAADARFALSDQELRKWLYDYFQQPHNKHASSQVQTGADTPLEAMTSVADAPKPADEPMAYAIHGIGPGGKQYVFDIKKWAGPDSLSDDGGLGDYWAGNTTLGPIPDEKPSAP